MMRSWTWMLAAAALGALAPAAMAQADAKDELVAYVMLGAERDFDAVRQEAALSGSAPLVGTEGEKKPARKPGKAKKARAEAGTKPEAKRATAMEPVPAAVGRP